MTRTCAMDHARRNLGIGSGMSTAAHGLAAMLLSVAPAAPERRVEPEASYVVLSIATTAPIRIERDLRSTPTPPIPQIPSRPHRVVPSSGPPPFVDASQPMPTDVAPAPIDSVPVPTPRIPSPRELAQSMTMDESGPTMPVPSAPPDVPTGPMMTDAEAVAVQEEWLRARARERPVTRRAPPRLTPHPDGTRTWTGPSFTATVDPDGSVRFSDRPGITYDWTRGEGTLDLDGMVMQSAGQDPFVAERMWFMEETVAEREQLEDAARAESEAIALRRLRGQLVVLWDDEQRSALERRRAIFSLWDECGEDTHGRAARELITAFIRETLPRGSADAYGPAEIEALDTQRSSTEPFAPY